jgi:hypothetical protein
MRFRVTHLLVALALAATALFAAGCSDRPPVVPKWPVVAEVKAISASLSESTMFDQKKSDAFPVPPHLIPALLRVFDPPVYRRDAPRKQVQDIAKLEIQCHDGRILDVRVLFWATEPAFFSIDGIPCWRGGEYKSVSDDPNTEKGSAESLGIGGMIKAIQQNDEVKFNSRLRSLDIAAGRPRLVTSE